MDLIEAEDIKRWQEYTELSSVQLPSHVQLFANTQNYTKNIFMKQITMMV